VELHNPSKESTMATNAASHTDEETSPAGGGGPVEMLERTLDQWRGRLDGLKVQVDLATLDVREDLAKRLEVTENLYLAVRSRLSDARHDTGRDVAKVGQAVDQLLLDLRLAYDDAEAVMKRSRA
jgi:hypothetical protein